LQLQKKDEIIPRLKWELTIQADKIVTQQQEIVAQQLKIDNLECIVSEIRSDMKKKDKEDKRMITSFFFNSPGR
jgi:hypothetical protein